MVQILDNNPTFGQQLGRALGKQTGKFASNFAEDMALKKEVLMLLDLLDMRGMLQLRKASNVRR